MLRYEFQTENFANLVPEILLPLATAKVQHRELPWCDQKNVSSYVRLGKGHMFKQRYFCGRL